MDQQITKPPKPIPENRLKWHEDRLTSIGASESPAVIGVSPFSSPIAVWARKTGRYVEQESPVQVEERLRWGKVLEPVILAEYGERTGRARLRMHPQDQVVRHNDFPKMPMGCTPDAFDDDDEERIIQIKTTSAWNAKEWDGDDPPLHVVVQVQHEMSVCEKSRATVLALIGGQRLRWFEIERNDAFIDALEIKLMNWWETYVAADVEPPADASRLSVRTLERLHPDDSGDHVLLGEEFVDVDAMLVETKKTIKMLEKQREDLENRIKASIGAATFGVLPGGVAYSWKTQDRKGYTVDDTKFRVLRRTKS